MNCVRCDRYQAVCWDGLCAVCVVSVRVEVSRGLVLLAEYLRWAR